MTFRPTARAESCTPNGRPFLYRHDMLEGHHAELVVLGRVCLAVALGAAIAVEREFADKPPGFRTHVLVAGSACLPRSA